MSNLEGVNPNTNPKKPGVYCIFCHANGKLYIGSAMRPVNRKSEHFSGLRLNKHHSSYLQHSWNKYGDGVFSFVLLENTDEDNLLELEQEYIDIFLACDKRYGFNSAPIAGNTLGTKRSQETKTKIAQKAKGRIKSSETVARLKQAWIDNGENWTKRDIQNRGRDFEIMSPEGKIVRGRGVKQFAREHGLHNAQLFRVLNGTNISIRGWKLPTTRDRDYHLIDPKGDLVTVRRGELATFSKKMGLNAVRLGQVWNKRVLSYRGWTRQNVPEPLTMITQAA